MTEYNRTLDHRFKKFINFSIRHFYRHHPKFQRNKAVAYQMVKPYVKIPKRYYLVRDPKKFNLKKLRSLPDYFVLKALVGGGGRQVICAQRHPPTITQKSLYSDLLHQKHQYLTEKKFLRYVRRKMKGGTFLVEQFLGVAKNNKTNTKNVIPNDYKVFVTQGKVSWIGVYDRNPVGKGYLGFFDRDWQYHSKDQIYAKFNKYDCYPKNKIPKPPSQKTQKKLIQVAEKLSKKQKTYFVRYDLYVIDEEIYFGEITIASGGFLYYKVNPITINKVYPKKLRKTLKL